jgi:hypothetical protein
MRKKALTKDERKIQIINWFAIRIQRDNEDIASLSEIAKGLGLSPSSHLRAILDEMAYEDETLETSALERPGRWLGRGYMLKRGSFQRPAKQTIKINFTVRGIKQMELL